MYFKVLFFSLLVLVVGNASAYQSFQENKITKEEKIVKQETKDMVEVKAKEVAEVKTKDVDEEEAKDVDEEEAKDADEEEAKDADEEEAKDKIICVKTKILGTRISKKVCYNPAKLKLDKERSREGLKELQNQPSSPRIPESGRTP